MAGETIKRRLAAVVAADMVGYSHLMGLDEAGTLVRQKACLNELILPKISEFQGRLVKTTGDGLLAEFPSAVDAVLCSVAVQREMVAREANVEEDRRIRYRVGINVGEIIYDGDDIFGDGVNVAARLEALAEPGGIRISESVFNTIKGKLDLGFADLGAHQVKNIAQPVTVYSVLLDPEDAGKFLRAPTRRPASRPLLAALSVLFVAVIGIAVFFFWTRSNPPPAAAETRLLILPYQSAAADAQLEAEAVSENLWLTMAQLKGVTIVPRSAAQSLAGIEPTSAQIGELGAVTHILDGKVERSGDGITISSRLRRVGDGARETIWQHQDSAVSENLFAALNRQKPGLASELKLVLNAREREILARTFTQKPAAFVDYVQAKYIYDSFAFSDFRKAMDLFERASQADPDFVDAKIGFARANYHVWQAEWSIIKNTLEARIAAEKTVADILANDPDNPEALAVRIRIRMLMLQREEALAMAKAAIFRNPDSPELRNVLGWTLIATGDYAAAKEAFETFAVSVPRLSPTALANLATAFLRLNEPQRALSLILPFYDRSLPYQGFDWTLTEAFARTGDIEAAKHSMQRIIQTTTPLANLTWQRQFFEIFEDPSIFEAYAEAMRAAAMPEWPFNLDKTLAPDRLDEAALKALAEPGFKPVEATDEFQGPFEIEVRSDGTAYFKLSYIPSAYNGVWKIEGNQFCMRFPDLYKGRFACELFFRDRERDTPELEHYVMLGRFGARKLAIERTAE